jgi:hypothetical protein
MQQVRFIMMMMMIPLRDQLGVEFANCSLQGETANLGASHPKAVQVAAVGTS